MKINGNDLKNNSQNFNLSKSEMKERLTTNLPPIKLRDSKIYENINETHLKYENQYKNKTSNEKNKNMASYKYCFDNLSDSTNPSTNKDYTKFYKKKNNGYKNGKYKIFSLFQVIENKKHFKDYNKKKEKKEKKVLSSSYIYKKKIPSSTLNNYKSMPKNFISNNNNSSEKNKWELDEKKNMEHYKYKTKDKKEKEENLVEIEELPDIEINKKMYVKDYFNIYDDNDSNTSYLDNIKKLLSISDEQLKDVVNISNFSIDLDINNFYNFFIKENSDYSILYYNINHNKNVYDIKEHVKYANEKIITYKQVSSLNFGMHVCNVSIQELCYFYYRLYNNKSYHNLKYKENYLKSPKTPKNDSTNNCVTDNYFNSIKHEMEKTSTIDTIKNNEIKENSFYLNELDHVNLYDSIYDTKTYNNDIDERTNRDNKNISINSDKYCNYLNNDNNNNTNNNNYNNNYNITNNEKDDNQCINTFRKTKSLPSKLIKILSIHNNKDVDNLKEKELKKKKIRNINIDIEKDNNKKNYKKNFKMKRVSTDVLYDQKKYHTYYNNCSEIKCICNDASRSKDDINYSINEISCKNKNVNKSYFNNNMKCIDDKYKCDHQSFMVNSCNNFKKLNIFKKHYQCVEENEKEKINKIKNFFIKTFKRRKIKGINHYIRNDDISNDNKNEHIINNNLNKNIISGNSKKKFNKALGKQNITKNLLMKFKNFCKSKTTNKRAHTEINNHILTYNNIQKDENRLNMTKNITEKNNSSFNNEELFKQNVNNEENNKNKAEYIEVNNNLKNMSLEENFRNFSNLYCKDGEKDSRKILTNEYIDNNFDEIYYIQRINADNDLFSIFINIYQIYIFSKENSNDEKAIKCNEDAGNNNRTLVSIYLFIDVESNFFKYLIKKKIFNEINNCISNWKEYLMMNIQNIKGITPISVKINNNRNNDHINNVIQHIKCFINDYLKEIIHNLLSNFFYFMGVHEDKTLKYYFSNFNRNPGFVHKKNRSFKSMYNQITKKKNKNEKKKETILEKKKDLFKSKFLYLFKKKNNMNESNLHNLHLLNNSSNNESFYITSHEVAYNYITYVNNIYFRRIIFLYLLVFFFFFNVN